MGLRRVHEAFEQEMEKALNGNNSAEYYRFLKALGFYDFIEQVITACAMFPRSIQASEDNLTDLSFGIYNELGLGKHYLTSEDQENLCKLVLAAGKEVISQLDGHRYYFEKHQIPKWCRDDPRYATDLEAISDISRISTYAYQVTVDEYHVDDEPEIQQYAETKNPAPFWSF